MRYVKKSALIVIPLAILAAAGALAVRRMGGAAPIVRAAAEEAISSALSRKVSIASARFSWNGELVLGGIEVADRPGRPLARVRQVTVRYAYRPGRNLLRNVRSVEVEDPVINLSRDEKGRWNIQDLLVRKPARPSPFSASVTIKGGKVVLTDASGKSLRDATFDNVAARILFSTSAEGQFAMSAHGPSGLVSLVSASGDFRPGGGSVTLAATGLALEPVTSRFAPDKVVRVTSGTADVNAYVSASPQRKGWKNADYVAVADVRGCDLKLARLAEPIRNLAGRFSVASRGGAGAASGNVLVESASAYLGRDRLQASGALTNWSSPVLDFEVSGALDVPWTLKALRQKPLPPEVRIESPAQFSVTIKGRLSNPSVEGTGKVEAASVRGIEVSEAQARVSFGGRRLALNGITARAAGGMVEGDGWVALGASPMAVFRMELRGVEAGPALAKAGVEAPVSGIASGPVWASWRPGRVRVVAKPSLTNGRAYKLPVQSFYMDATLEKGGVVLNRASAASPAAALEASGRVSEDGSVGLKFSAARLDLAQAASAFGQRDLSGHGDAWGRVSGTLKEPRVDGYVQLAQVRFKEQGVDLLSAHVSGSRKAVRIWEATAYRGASEFAISGALTGTDWSKRTGQADVLVKTERASLGDLLETAGIKARATGAVAASVSISGPFDGIHVSGEAHTGGAFIGGQYIQSSRASFDWAGGGFSLKDFKVALPSSAISASGEMKADGSLDFGFEAPSANLADLDLKALAGLDLGASGRVDLAGHVRGTAKEPVVVATLRSPGFSLNGTKIDGAEIEASVKGSVATIEQATLSQAGGLYSASGIIDTKQRTMDLTLDVKEASLTAIRSTVESLAPALGEGMKSAGTRLRSLPRPMRGAVNAHATMAGPFSSPAGQADVTASGITVAEDELPNLEASVAFEWPVLRITTAQATRGDAYATATGTIDLKGDTNLEIDGYNLGAQLLEPWLKTGYNIAGTGDVSISVSGPTKSPTVTGSADISDFSFGSVSFDRVRATSFDVTPAGLEIQEILLTKGPHYLVIAGMVPFAWSSFSIPKDKDLHISVTLKDQDLDFAKAFLPSIGEASGPLNANLVIGGTRSHLVLEQGALSISDGRVQSKTFGEFKKIWADVALSENLVTVKRLQAAGSKGGSLSVRPDSTIRIDSFDPERLAFNRFDVGLTLRDFMVRGGGMASGPVRADLSLTNGEDGRAALKGKVVAEPGWQVQLAETEAGGAEWTGPPLNPVLDIDLEVQPFMHITSAAAEISMAGEGRISGTLADPAVSVGLEGRRGWLLFPAARLQLTFASAEISVVRRGPRGQLEPRVILHLEGNATVAGYQVYVTLSGSLDNLVVSRRSVPALSDQQVDALLTAGAVPPSGVGPPGAGLRETAREVLVTGLGTVALSPLERRAAAGLGLEELSFELGYGQPVRVRVGTYVLRGLLKGNLYMTYARSLGGFSPTSYFRVTYQVLPSLFLGWSVDERDVTRVELQRTIRF